MNFNLNDGDWVVQALKAIEDSTHLRNLAYGVVLALLLWVIR